MQVGYVALIDVLGFSSLVSGDSEGRRLEVYLNTLEAALGAPTREVKSVVFSDSIVLTTEHDAPTSLQALVLRCSKLLGLMLQSDIALRGAIAHGSFVRRDLQDGIFVAGTAIVAAHRFDTAQGLVGIMLSPSALRHVSRPRKPCALSRPPR